ncbi:hypothetical protein B0A55_02027 [Friedmanniomyces simplex]|uniref:Heterokaryon incompatibility domain-containing protein n=1 Tax=Friedmanniomyces simplex TaxID=329884 RepID=A0A4U0XYX4_9PEZI|nr:hypothetical protein B0A55_02027 [Friedmanniomyces simplex]
MALQHDTKLADADTDATRFDDGEVVGEYERPAGHDGLHAHGATFAYDALPPPSEGQFIRLTEILGELTQAGCVQCLLHQAPFDHDTPNYETLSYCWGTSSDLHTNPCNGQRLQVTQTEHKALHALRIPDRSRLVWIDQPCINQKDDAEKVQQVTIMQDIYQRSSLTIAWLGDASDHTDTALKAAHRIIMAATSDAFLKTLREAFGGPWSAHSMKRLVERRRDWGDARPSRSEWTSMSVLRGRPWFTRMWVIQEVAVSGRVLLQCGEARLDFAELMWAVSLAMMSTADRKRQVSLGHSAMKQLTFLSSSRQAEPSDARLRLPRLLRAAQSFGATDPRDKLFTLYGLTITDLSSLDLKADYSSPADWVYMKTLSTLMRESGSLQLLELPLSLTHLPLNPCPYPGWEDLDERERQEAIEQVLNDTRSEEEEAAQKFSLLAVSEGSKLSTFVLEDSGALRLSGQLVDKVNQTSRALKVPLFVGCEYYTVMDEASTQKEGLQAYGGIMKDTYRGVREYAQALTERDEMVMARASTSYPTGEPLLTAYRKALTAGSVLLNEDDAAEVFAEWRKLFKPARFISKLGNLLGAPGGLAIAGLAVGGQTVSRETRDAALSGFENGSGWKNEVSILHLL